MIELKDAQKQMERMMDLEFGPRGREQRAEVLRVMRTARTFPILESAVTSWVDSQAKFPKPAEMRVIIAALNTAQDEKVSEARAVCIACGGSGWVQTRGINPFDGLEVAGAQPCVCRSMGQPVVADRDACATCGGHGIYGGQIGTGQFDGPWKWCGCPAGEERRSREPGLVSEANAAREKIIRKFGAKPLPGMLKQLAGEDGYHGEF